MSQPHLSTPSEVTAAFERFFRNMIRGIAANDPTSAALRMMDDFDFIENLLSCPGPDIRMAFVFKNAIRALRHYPQDGGSTEAQFDFVLAGMRHLMELSSTDKLRAGRLSRSRYQMRRALEWLDKVRKPRSRPGLSSNTR
jgi:hypothetical protein